MKCCKAAEPYTFIEHKQDIQHKQDINSPLLIQLVFSNFIHFLHISLLYLHSLPIVKL